jgi:hypothetical protein
MVLLLAVAGLGSHSLYHVYDVWSIPTALERVLRYILYLLPYEVKDGELKTIDIGGHDSYDVLIIGRNLGPTSFPRSHGRPNESVYVCIEGEHIRGLTKISLLVLGYIN